MRTYISALCSLLFCVFIYTSAPANTYQGTIIKKDLKQSIAWVHSPVHKDIFLMDMHSLEDAVLTVLNEGNDITFTLDSDKRITSISPSK